ncbi:MAG TPA: transporter [Candidatus Merdenecus merdavium]|nr:transporter [Candidatus Merdenecus merdavium]
MAPPFRDGRNRGVASEGMPLSAPPRNPPPKPMTGRGAGARAVDPGTIRNCIGRFTYIWLDNGEEFWLFPVEVGRQSVAGFRWTRFGWAFMGISLNRIDIFTCI